MIIALFMAVVLVAILQTMMGVGQAIVTRETVQDGADATAYAAAVYDARGMNVIAMANLIMAAVLSVLVALKIAQILLVTANAISCLIPFLDGICAVTTDFEPRLNQLISDVSRAEPTILKALNRTSKGVAEVMPWIAEARSLFVTADYGPAMDFGVTASVAMIPGQTIDAALEKAAEEHGASSRTEGGDGGVASSTESSGTTNDEHGDSSDPKFLKNGRLGLPVQEDSFSRLCDAAGKVAVEAPVDTLIHNAALSDAMRIVGNLVGTLVSSVPAYFCGGNGADDKELAKAACQAGNKLVKDHSSNSGGKKKTTTIPNCAEQVKGKTETTKDSASTLEEADDEAPMKVYEAAAFGTAYYQVWSFAEASPRPGGGARWFYAEAEFYYDLGNGDFSFGHGQVQTFPTDGMWNMRWRARLRRVRMPVPQVAAVLGSYLTDQAQDLVTEAIDKLKPRRGDVGDLTKSSQLGAVFMDAFAPLTQAADTIDRNTVDKVNVTFGMKH